MKSRSLGIGKSPHHRTRVSQKAQGEVHVPKLLVGTLWTDCEYEAFKGLWAREQHEEVELLGTRL